MLMINLSNDFGNTDYIIYYYYEILISVVPW